jgi:hypothetical protein
MAAGGIPADFGNQSYKPTGVQNIGASHGAHFLGSLINPTSRVRYPVEIAQWAMDRQSGWDRGRSRHDAATERSPRQVGGAPEYAGRFARSTLAYRGRLIDPARGKSTRWVARLRLTGPLAGGVSPRSTTKAVASPALGGSAVMARVAEGV